MTDVKLAKMRKNKHWIYPDLTIEDDLFNSIIKHRNIKNLDEYLYPTLSHLQDPFDMYGTQDFIKFIENLKKNNNKKIFIHGDFDVDGVSSTALLWRFLYHELKMDVTPYIPSRFEEGYGLSRSSIEKIIQMGGKVIITVDCGIKDIELIEEYSDQIEFIITDHHTPISKDLCSKFNKKAFTVINEYIVTNKSKVLVHPYINKTTNDKKTEISGAMVVYKLCIALNEYLKLNANMFMYSIFPALGTICDVMPLVDENRTITKIGIDAMKQGLNVGINSLLQIAGIDKNSLKSYHIGFIIGPRLNASGRIESAMKSLRLLCTDSNEYAEQIAKELNKINSERQFLTQYYLQQAEKLISLENNKKIIFIIGNAWPEGILGLIASKLTEKYEKPTIVGTTTENKIIKASARSIDGIHIAKLLEKTKDFLIKFGGHEKAAGLTFKEDHTDEVKNTIVNSLNSLNIDYSAMNKFKIDARLIVSEKIIPDIVNLSLLEPFGYKNEEPIFLIEKSVIQKIVNFGKNLEHTKLFLKQKEYIFQSIFFNQNDNQRELKQNYDFSNERYSIDIIGKIKINEYKQNKNIEVNLLDYKLN